jgi:hypothetical protein
MSELYADWLCKTTACSLPIAPDVTSTFFPASLSEPKRTYWSSELGGVWAWTPTAEATLARSASRKIRRLDAIWFPSTFLVVGGEPRTCCIDCARLGARCFP